MEKTLILFPATLMMVLALSLYVKNYLDNVKAKKSDAIKFSYFKTYKGEVPDYVKESGKLTMWDISDPATHVARANELFDEIKILVDELVQEIG